MAAVENGLRAFACARCSRRKQRCDKLTPVCGPCQAAGSLCVDSAKERLFVRVEGHGVARKGYVRALEEHLAMLEGRAREAGLLSTGGVVCDQGRSSGDTQTVTRAEITSLCGPASSDTTGSGRTAGDTSTNGEERPEPDNTGDAWSLEYANMDSLSLSAMAEPRNRAGEFLTELSMPHIIAGVTETYGGDPERTTRVDSLWDGIARYIRRPGSDTDHRIYVQQAEAYQALGTYLEVVDFRYPRLPVKKARNGIAAISSPDTSLYSRMLLENPSHIFIAYMVIAIVPLVSGNYPVAQGSYISIHLLAKSLSVLDKVFRHEDGVDIVQCLQLLVVFSVHSSAAGSPWHLVGFAMNKCIALGYHRDTPARSGQTDDEIQQRRWAFWSCYLLDRLICTALERPFSIEDRYITAPLPRDGVPSPSAGACTESLQVHLFRYASLMSYASESGQPGDFNTHLGHILHWRASTPEHTDGPVDELYGYQTSLYNTLMLRLLLRWIVLSDDWQTLDDACGPGQESIRRSPEDMRRMLQWMKQHRLFETCRAVAQSLNRHSMRRRPFLSMITGYSALTMALVAMYWPAVARLADPGGDEVSKSLEAMDFVAEVAVEKLDVVGRQFPRMLEYRRLVMLLWRIICSLGERAGDGYKEAENLVEQVGPIYAKRLAQLILVLSRPAAAP
ncbi:hypothetical protein VUR80DRAFT_2685 [Thermomyces stellatus]